MSWLTDKEVRSAAHIGRGTAMAIIFWVAGAWLFSLHWAMTSALVGTLLASLLWELIDHQRYLKGKFLFWKTPSDPFDIWDVAADVTGALLVAAFAGLYQLHEKWLYNWPGVF